MQSEPKFQKKVWNTTGKLIDGNTEKYNSSAHRKLLSG